LEKMAQGAMLMRTSPTFERKKWRGRNLPRGKGPQYDGVVSVRETTVGLEALRRPSVAPWWLIAATIVAFGVFVGGAALAGRVGPEIKRTSCVWGSRQVLVHGEVHNRLPYGRTYQITPRVWLRGVGEVRSGFAIVHVSGWSTSQWDARVRMPRVLRGTKIDGCAASGRQWSAPEHD
jgi:hypothetical protein